MVAADGAASRFGEARRRPPRSDAGRWGSPRDATTACDYHPGPWFESWLDLWDGDLLLPGYGWLFPVAGGRINLGAGLLNTFANFKDVSAQRLFDAFATMLPPEWGIDEDTAEGRVLSGPLPMGMNRTPPAVPGLLLVGDAAGAVNPFNGEGIAYAMETGEIAAELIHEALVQRPARRSRCMYRQVLRERYGGYFPIGRRFAKVIGQPDDHGTRDDAPAAASRGHGVRPAADGEPHRRARTATCRTHARSRRSGWRKAA